MTYTIEMARKLLDDAGCAFLQTERGKCLKSMVEQLAAVTAERDALKSVEARVLADRNYIIAENVRLSAQASHCDELREALTAERDALKAKLATINHIAISLFVRTTSSEVTGEMAEIGRLSREDGQ